MKSLATGMPARRRQWVGPGVLALAVLMSAPAFGQESGEADATRNEAADESDKTEANKASDDAKSAAKDDSVTHPIRVTADQAWEALGGGTGDLGTTVLGRDSFDVRTNGSGDANSFLRSMPNVQYINNDDLDPGEDQEDVINLQPQQFSISGGRLYENNIMLNGVGINTYSGSVERSEDSLTTADGLPNADLIYGLHPQTIYVPSSMVDKVTVVDSDASARYGDFQGGVVEYKLIDPPKDKYLGGVDVSYQTEDFVHYRLATDDKQNPLGKEHPEFDKSQSAAWVGGPISDRFRWIGGVSLDTAGTRKQRDYKYYSGWIDQDSSRLFAHTAGVLDTDIGEFKLEGSLTDYDQDFESNTHLGLRNDVDMFSYVVQLRHTAELGGINFAGIDFSNLGIETTAYLQDASTKNDSNDNLLYSYTVKESSGWTSSEIDWCRPEPTSGNTICYRGGYGDREQEELQTGLKSEITGDVAGGTFVLGAGSRYVKARRARPEDMTFYSSSRTVDDEGVAAFTCPPNDPYCSPEQYGRIRTVWEAYDITADVTLADAYAEVTRQWDWFGLRAGLRLDYNDYNVNFDLAPRVVATANVLPDVTLSAGFNRYYSSREAIAMAVRDAQPRGQAYMRSAPGGVVSSTWTQLGNSGDFGNSASGLKTPYVDEFTAGLVWHEPLFDGVVRFRGINRQKRDQYAVAGNSSVNNTWLTNEGSGFYKSLTLEYLRSWEVDDAGPLTRLGFKTSATWEDRKVSNNTYFENDDIETYIYYKGQSYTRSEFKKVTGNLQIPVNLDVALISGWFNDRVELGMSADVNFPYQGVRYTGERYIGGIWHAAYDDYQYKTNVFVDAMARARLWDWSEDGGLSLELRVENVFDTIGDRVASDDNPFVRGRTFWIGASATF